jgi:AcrR family transcriptional regulator
MEYPWNKWDEKGWERANKIGKTAAKLFSRKSYFDTTIDEIAAGGRFSKGSVYYYFKSKSDILFFILFHYMDKFLKNLENLDTIHTSEKKLICIISCISNFTPTTCMKEKYSYMIPTVYPKNTIISLQKNNGPILRLWRGLYHHS